MKNSDELHEKPNASLSSQVLGRLEIYIGIVSSVLFLAIYARLVCPFIEKLPPVDLALNLGSVMIFHLLLREWLSSSRLLRHPSRSAARRGYLLSILTWLVAGALAMLLHQYRYPDFPVASHVKLFSGYVALGAGILAQWEYGVLERRRNSGERVVERLGKRLTESLLVFSLVPVAVLLLVVFRYKQEGLIRFDVANEIYFVASYFVITALLVAFRYAFVLRTDSNDILNAVRQLKKGELDIEIAAMRQDELGELAEGVRNMALGIKDKEQIKDAFGRFVSHGVAEKFISDHIGKGSQEVLGGKRMNVTILMCDLRNFTTFSESVEPEVLTNFLNLFFTRMVDVVHGHNGMVNKFMGDAIMAVFGLDEPDDASALHAVNAAEEMLTVMNDINRESGSAMTCGIGIHSGEVVAGYFGSEERLEFTVIGFPVNMASRIEALCKHPNPPLLFSQKVAGLISGKKESLSVGEFTLRGITGPVQLHTLKSIAG